MRFRAVKIEEKRERERQRERAFRVLSTGVWYALQILLIFKFRRSIEEKWPLLESQDVRLF